MATFDASELEKLSREIQEANARRVHKARGIGHELGKAVKERWRANAKESAGSHGVHYPRSITYQVKGGKEGLDIEVGPESGRPQGGMGPGFEYGSVNQPPHLDGQKALDAATPKIVAGAILLSDLFE